MTAPALPVAIAFISFVLIHSLTVSRSFKGMATRRLGEPWMRRWYRLGYTLTSAVTAALAAYVIWLQPDEFLYRPPWYILWPAHAVQFAGVGLLLWANRQADMGFFTGIRQAFSHTGGGGDIEGIPEGGLITTGAYGLVRHPMYLGGICMFLFEPNVTVNCLVLRLLATAYFIWGGFIEERRFLGDFGGAYREYQRVVPMWNLFSR